MTTVPGGPDPVTEARGITPLAPMAPPLPPLLPGALPPEALAPADPAATRATEALASHPSDTSSPDRVEGLREEIEHTRAELGETLEALAAKADVKARLRDAADDAKERVRERVHEVAERTGEATGVVRRYRVELLALVGAAVAVLVFLRWRRGRAT
jgi:hypothetical protein